MNVYRLQPDYDRHGNSPWDWLLYRGDSEDLDGLLKRPRLQRRWKAPKVSLQRERKGSADFFYLSTNDCYAVNPSAAAALAPLLGKTVEFLPLKCPELGKVSVIHALEQVSLSDDAEVRRVMGDNITVIRRYSFRPEDLEGRHYFLTRQPPDSSAGKAGTGGIGPLVSEEFKAVVEERKLKGVSFKQVFPHL